MKKRKKIAIIGCSFSCWRDGSKQNPTAWPEHLSKICRNITVFDYSMYVNSNTYQFEQARQIFERNPDKIDALILQWTTLNRRTFVKDAPEFIPSLQYKAPNYYYLEERKYTDIKNFSHMVHINPGTLDSQKSILRKNKFADCYETELAYSISDVNHASHHILEAYQQNIDSEAKKHNISLLQFGWFDVHKPCSGFSIEEELGFDKFVVDEGLHFGCEGSKKIAESLIRPWIQNNV